MPIDFPFLCPTQWRTVGQVIGGGGQSDLREQSDPAGEGSRRGLTPPPSLRHWLMIIASLDRKGRD